MNKELNINNSKKLIIGISILFCTVILIIGGSIAYFTQSDSETTGDIVATDEVTLDYQDNDDYMLGDLIPIDEQYVKTAYEREGLNKCKDNLGYNVCSIYQFTITNTGNVVQDIIMNMHPKVNGFTNLKFNLYDITNDEQIVFNQGLTLNSEELVPLVNDLTLDTNNNKSNIYELVFYIQNDPNNDQSHLDAGVRFGANIEVNSVTTGTYLLKELGDAGCWKADEENPTIISEFIGYTDKNGNLNFDESDEIKKECEVYFKKDTDNYYIVNVPSSYGGYNFTSVGNNLFQAGIFDEYTNAIGTNEYGKIKSITIDEGITTIEDGDSNLYSGAFSYIGTNVDDWTFTHEVSLTLPSTLTNIGDFAFYANGIKQLNLPQNINTIGEKSFYSCNITSDINNPLIIPYSVTLIKTYAFSENNNNTRMIFENSEISANEDNKLTIENGVFKNNNLTYLTEEDYFVVPARLVSVGILAFGGDSSQINNRNLLYAKYLGNSSDLPDLQVALQHGGEDSTILP